MCETIQGLQIQSGKPIRNPDAQTVYVAHLAPEPHRTRQAELHDCISLFIELVAVNAVSQLTPDCKTFAHMRIVCAPTVLDFAEVAFQKTQRHSRLQARDAN